MSGKKTEASRGVYCDFAAATPVRSSVLSLWAKCQRTFWANPSSLHAPGVRAAKVLKEAHQRVARLLGVRSSEIVFTSGATESNNQAIFGVLNLEAARKKKPHVIASVLEHISLQEPLKQAEKKGWCRVSWLPVREDGRVDLNVLPRLLRPETVLVSVGYVNNELGVIQPLQQIGRILAQYREKRNNPFPYLHSDCAQAPRFLPLAPHSLGVDLMTLDGLKIYGPRGVGILYVRHGVLLHPYIWGANQERGLRAGTENVCGALAFASALERVWQERGKEMQCMEGLTNYFLQELKKTFPSAEVFGGKARVPGIISVFFPGIDSEECVLRADAQGVFFSSGAACSKDEDYLYSPSVAALPGGESKARHTLRFSFGLTTTKDDLDYVIKILRRVIPSRR